MKIGKLFFLLLVSMLLNGCDGDSAMSPSSPTNPSTTTSELPAELLEAFGADPNKADTDGDGLSDEFEIKYGYPFIKPDSTDTDGNGIGDADEDLDSDGLTNIQEQQYKTDSLTKDTDGDSLSDGDEVLTYNTNPLVADTDGDDIPDGREVANGSDPLVSDAGKVVTSKNAETIIDPSTGAETNISVSLTGAGDLAGKLVVRGASDIDIPGQVGKQYDISFDGTDLSTLQGAEVTLPYDETDSDAADPSKLVIATINPITGLWEQLPSTIDYANKTITATTTHFSDYVVINGETHNNYLSTIQQTCDAITDPDALPTDAVLVIDSSGSMTSNDPSNIRRSAAKAFVDQMKATDQVAVVDFDSSARLAIGLSGNKTAINNAIDTIDSSGGTNIGAGVSLALQQLQNSDRSKIRAIILLTDGQGSYDTNLTTQLASQGVRVFTIGLGSSVDTALLNSIANATGGKYKQISDANGLVGIFKEFSSVFGDDGTDTDKDGLTDCQETQGIFSAGFGIIKTDIYKTDSDGDGLPDGVEVGVPYKTPIYVGTPWTSKAISDPNNDDTDSDQVSDYDEFDEDTNPLARDSDFDGFSDLDELENGSDPNDINDPAEQKVISTSRFTNAINYAKKWLEVNVDFTKGAIGGEWIEVDTWAEFTGLTVMNFVPTCGVSDLSNSIAEYIKGEYISGSITFAAAGTGVAECVSAVSTTGSAGAAAPVFIYTVTADGGTALARQVFITAKFLKKLGTSQKVIAKFYRVLSGINIGGVTVDDILIPVIKQIDGSTFNALVKSGLSESDALKAMAGMLKKGTYAQKLGKAGEDAVRAVYDIGKKPVEPIRINGRPRIPDGLTDDTLNEIKNVKYQGLTRQLQDYLQYAKGSGRDMVLWIRGEPNKTVFSKVLQEKVDSGEIIIKYIP